MQDLIATRKLIGLSAGGEEFDINIKIGKPVQESEHDWICPIAIDGLHDKTMHVQDIDSFAVLRQAIELAYFYLEQHEADGGKFFWAFNRQPVTTKDDVF